jgi:hypothetical protein
MPWRESTAARAAVTDVFEGAALARPQKERRSFESREQLVSRLRGEFVEMPCLSLTLQQSMRLFDLPEDVCRRVLDALVREGSIWQRHDGRYAGRSAS